MHLGGKCRKIMKKADFPWYFVATPGGHETVPSTLGNSESTLESLDGVYSDIWGDLEKFDFHLNFWSF